MAHSIPNATDVDRQVGERIRRRRVLLGLTQDQLAERLGISYQQVQKYETGANRVSAGRLFQISVFLETSVGHYFEGLGAEPHTDVADAEISSSRNVIDLVRGFSRIEDEKIRASIMTLVRTLSESQAEVSAPAMNGILANGSGANGASAGRLG